MKKIVLTVIVMCAAVLFVSCHEKKDPVETPTMPIAARPTLTVITAPPTATLAPTLETPPPFEVEHAETPEPMPYREPTYTDEDVVMLAKTVWGEARGCAADEQRLVIWTILQRVDSDSNDFKNWNTIAAVITAQEQFAGYAASNPLDPDIYALCAEELEKWDNGEEPPTHDKYAPTLPYYYFDGDGQHNRFRKNWR